MEKNSSRDNFPVKCLECAKSSRPFIHGRCGYCRNLSFQEEVLCCLNRATQNPSSFECHAFVPLLKLVTSSGQENRPESIVQHAEITIDKLLDTDKIKYQRALALQKLARYPDEVMLDIKYHFVWNVIGRRPAFAEPEPMIEFISDTITTCSEAVGGFASLMWLAPDHIHIYMESDGKVSPENIAQKLKRLSETPIIDQFRNVITSQEFGTGLWDEAYFVETVG